VSDLSTTVGGPLAEKIKSYVDVVVRLGDWLKVIIPGQMDDDIVDLAHYLQAHPEAIDFVEKVVNLVSKLAQHKDAVAAAIAKGE
jgi:hypothetical protein